MYRILVSAALIVLVQSQCLLTRKNIAPSSGVCTLEGMTAPCKDACARDVIGNNFGTLTTAECAGRFTNACSCTFASTKYKTSCPAGHTDTTPCVDAMPKAWCTSMCSSSIAQVQATICRDTCTCSLG